MSSRRASGSSTNWCWTPRTPASPRSSPASPSGAGHEASIEVLVRGLEAMELLPVTADEALDPSSGIYQRYTLHGVSHMLGLDVHDCAAARNEKYNKGTLEAGYVLTVEPGLVLPGRRPDGPRGPARYRHPDRGRHPRHRRRHREPLRRDAPRDRSPPELDGRLTPPACRVEGFRARPRPDHTETFNPLFKVTMEVVILPAVRDPRLVTIRRGGTLTDEDHRLLALWATECAEHYESLLVEADQAGMQAIARLANTGALRAQIEATFPLAEAAKAHTLGEPAAPAARPCGQLRRPSVSRLNLGSGSVRASCGDLEHQTVTEDRVYLVHGHRLVSEATTGG